jgi:hypothetical protein
MRCGGKAILDPQLPKLAITHSRSAATGRFLHSAHLLKGISVRLGLIRQLLAIGFSLSSAAVSAQQINPKTFFPHHLGDTWKYAFYEPSSGLRDTFQTRIVTDSVLADGSFYVKFGSAAYLIDSLNQVFLIQSGGNIKLYDLGAPIGAWWWSRGPGSSAIEVDTIFESTVFGVPSTIKVLNNWFGAVDSSFVISKNFLATGFGLVQQNGYEADFNISYVIGAIIDSVRYGTLTSVTDKTKLIPTTYSLLQNYPNPFNAGTVIRFSLSHSADVTLTIYDLLGREVRVLGKQALFAGDHSMFWDGKDDEGRVLPSGVYLYRLMGKDIMVTRKAFLLK